MVTLTIDKSREYVIFQAFSQNDTFDRALTALETYDRDNPDRRIFASADEKLAMRDSYHVFKDAEKIISKDGQKPDYDNPQIIERMKTVLAQKLPPVSREMLKVYTESPAINKANIGRMMAMHARNIRTLGKKILKQNSEERREHEQAMVGRSGVTGHSPYDKVFSEKKSFKPIVQILQNRQQNESNA